MARSRQYTLDEKQAVALTFAITGSIRDTARQSGVPFETVRGWTHSEWWEDMQTQVRSEKDQEWDSKLSGVIDKLLARIEAESANLSLDKLPVSLGILYDKLRLHRNQPTAIRRTETVEQRIEKLNDNLRKLGQQDKIGITKPH